MVSGGSSRNADSGGVALATRGFRNRYTTGCNSARRNLPLAPITELMQEIRALQRKIGNSRRADLLFPGRGRPRPIEEWKRESEKILQRFREQPLPGE